MKYTGLHPRESPPRRTTTLIRLDTVANTINKRNASTINARGVKSESQDKLFSICKKFDFNKGSISHNVTFDIEM